MPARPPSADLQRMRLLFDVIVDLPEGITVVPMFAADKAEALEAGKELFPGHRVTGGAQGGRARYLVPTAAGPPEKE